MAFELYDNNYSTTLDGAIDSSVTTVVVNDIVPSALQTASGQWRLLVDSEIMLVTAVGGGGFSLTVTRSVEGTSAAAHGNGATATHVATKGAMDGIRADISSTAAFASRPAVNRNGNIFFPNNGFYIYRENGSAWSPWGEIFPMTAPVSGDFAWINQGGASVTTTNDGIHLSGPASASDSARIRKKSAPATPYTITAYVMPLLWGADFTQAGLCFRQNSTGELATCHIGFNSSVTGAIVLQSSKWDSPTVYNSAYATIVCPHALRWLRIADDGVSRICSYSTDGVNWITLHTVGRTDHLTADEVGFFVNTANSAVVGMTLLSWLQA